MYKPIHVKCLCRFVAHYEILFKRFVLSLSYKKGCCFISLCLRYTKRLLQFACMGFSTRCTERFSATKICVLNRSIPLMPLFTQFIYFCISSIVIPCQLKSKFFKYKVFSELFVLRVVDGGRKGKAGE